MDFRNLPKPPGLPVVGNLFQLNQDRIHLILEDWARTYGPRYRLRVFTTDALIVSDLQAIQQVLKERPGTFRRSKTIESVMVDMGVTGVVSAEGEHWKRQSRLILRGFNPAHLRGFFPQVVKVTSRLLKRWQANASREEVIDIQSDLMRYALDVVAGLAFGSDINTIDGADAVVDHLNRIFPMIHRRVNTPIPYWRYVKLPADRSFDRSLQALHAAIDDFVAQARRRIQANPSLLERPANLLEALVAARDEPNSGFTDHDVFGNVFSMLLAGGDGTANTIAWVIYFLAEQQEWQRRVQEEIDSSLAGQPLVQDFDQLSPSMLILDAIIQETMRLKPVFPILLHETIGEATVGDLTVPAGTLIVLLMRPTGLDPAHFPEPERFKPERWISASAGDSPSAPKGLLMPFGSGPRMCPGRLLAMQELKMTLTMLMRNFTVERLGEAPVGEALKFTMRPVGFRVRLRERHSDSV